jgi:PKD repeat protein
MKLIKAIFILIIFQASIIINAQERIGHNPLGDEVYNEFKQEKPFSGTYKSNCNAEFEIETQVFLSSNNTYNYNINLRYLGQYLPDHNYRYDFTNSNLFILYANHTFYPLSSIQTTINQWNNATEICLTVSNPSLNCEQQYCIPFSFQDIKELIISGATVLNDCEGFQCNLEFLPNLSNLEYEWQFFDGTQIEGNPVSFTYPQTGNYLNRITLTNPITSSKVTYQRNLYAFERSYTGLEIIYISNNINENIGNVLFGDCLEVENIQFNGSPRAIAYFFDEHEMIGFQEGLLITTGDAKIAKGLNNLFGAGVSNGTPGLAILNAAIPEGATFNAASISFDFTTSQDSVVASNFVFASEEYPEYVGSQFNDVFGFFIKPDQAPNAAYENLALIPGTTNDVVSINTINHLTNQDYYIENTLPNLQLVKTYQYDGFTKQIEIVKQLSSNQKYNFLVAIADASDEVYDSGVFIEAGSFAGYEPKPISRFSYKLNDFDVFFQNESSQAKYFEWDFGDGHTSTSFAPQHTYEQEGTYFVKLTCSGDCRKNVFRKKITIKKEKESEIPAQSFIVQVFDNNLNIKSNQDFKDMLVEIIDVSGRLVHSEKTSIKAGDSKLISLSNLGQGIYIARLMRTNGMKPELLRFFK